MERRRIWWRAGMPEPGCCWATAGRGQEEEDGGRALLFEPEVPAGEVCRGNGEWAVGAGDFVLAEMTLEWG